MKMMHNLEELLTGVKRVAVAGHIKPDGDCTGSCLATYNYIKEYHPDIQAGIYLEPIPNIFKFLSRADEIISDLTNFPETDLLIVQDCGDAGRLGKAAQLIQKAKRVACIDHHISNTGFGDDSYIFPKASSTSELVFDLIGAERLTRQIAECIYVGLIHDTGLFQYSCTSPKTMRTAAILMEMGIDFSGIADRTYVQKTYEQHQILAKAIEKSKLHLDGACISSIITQSEMEACHVLPKHLEGIVSQLRSTKGVEAAVFFYPKDEGGYKISFRSSSDAINVAAIAMHFGGGGHIRAAGASTDQPPDQCLEQILSLIQQQLETDDNHIRTLIQTD